MAKSFRKLPAAGRGVPAKPLSELDFLDLVGEPVAFTRPLVEPASESALPVDLTREAESASNTPNTGITGNSLPTDSPDTSGSTSNQNPSKQPQVAGNPGNTSKTVNTGKSSKKVKPSNPVTSASLTGPTLTADGGDVRQTFLLSRNHLEQLRDWVHARRTAGDYAYSQKQALQEALDLLFARNGLAAPRSDQAREREQQQREHIKKGRQLRNTKELPSGAGSAD
jgi:hypothetical protein